MPSALGSTCLQACLAWAPIRPPAAPKHRPALHPPALQVKLPCTLEGTQTAALLRESNIRVTLTVGEGAEGV